MLPPTAAATALFKQHFSYAPPHIVKAPGRLVLLGNHLDFNEGVVIAAAVDQYVAIASAPRPDGRIELISSADSVPMRFGLSELKPDPASPDISLIKSVLAQLRKRGVHFSGFSAAIYNAMPPDVDLGKSAAAAAAIALTVRNLHPFSLNETGVALPPKRDERGELPRLAQIERMQLAKLCHVAQQAAGNANASIADSIPSFLGKEWNVMNIDCRFLTVEHTPLIGETFVVCPAKPRKGSTLATDHDLRLLCASAARKLRAKSLRSVELSYLKANRNLLTDDEFACVYHVVAEIARVVAAERALRGDDHRQFGQYLFHSHESSRDQLKESSAELDLLVELARKHAGCLGARGMGQATLNLVSHHQAADFMQCMTARSEALADPQLRPIVCQMVDGAA